MCSEKLKISPFYSNLPYNSPQKMAARTKNGRLHCLEFQISLTSQTHISTKFTTAHM